MIILIFARNKRKLVLFFTVDSLMTKIHLLEQTFSHIILVIA